MINSRLIDVYKFSVPKIVRNRITMIRNAGGLNAIRKSILEYYGSSQALINDEVKEVLNYLVKNPLKLFPYSFPDKYKASRIKVYKDCERNLYYVLHEEKKMYFKRGSSINEIKESYKNLLIEQDKYSPHRYLTNNFNVDQNEVVADIGAAEGIFALSIIEHVKKIYLFETDNEWIEALKATFSPWIDKVEIINKFVSDNNENANITLDEFVKKHTISLTFIKIDVDGSELLLLKGCHEILSNSKKIKVAICTYHKAEDERIFQSILEEYGIAACPSFGYMIFYYDHDLTAPYLRRGLLRACN